MRIGPALLPAALMAALMAAPLPGAAQPPAPRLRVQATVDTLPNGLTLIVHEDQSVPTVATNVWFHVGSGDEKPGRTGFAHLFEHLMFMGSQHAPYPQFDRLLEAAGASNNGTTNNDRTSYYEWGPSNATPLMLWLEADRMGWLLPTADDAALNVARYILVGARNARLTNALVYEQEVSKDVFASNDSRKLDGDFAVVSTARPGVALDKVRQAIDREIARLAAEGPTARELEQARNAIEAGFLNRLEFVNAKAEQLNEYYYFTGTPDYFQRDLDRHRAVTAGDIKRVVAKYLTAPRVMLSIVPKGKKELAGAQAFIRERPPALGAPAPLTVPAVHTQRLANGIALSVVEQRELPLVQVIASFAGGSRLDGTAPGIATFTANMLDEGAGPRDAAALQAELAYLGASLQGGADWDRLYVSLKVPARSLGPALDLMADVIRRPAFSAAEIRRQRDLRLASLLQQRDQPEALGDLAKVRASIEALGLGEITTFDVKDVAK